MKKIFGVMVLCLAFAGCTDAFTSRIAAYGEPARITCYSGGKLIYDDCSTGKIVSEQNSDGYVLRSATTDEAIEVSGNCVITYNGECPETPLVQPSQDDNSN